MMDNRDLLTKHFPRLSRLSPSNITKWRGDYSDEGLWCLSYLFGVKFKGNAATARGTVVEDALMYLMEGKSVDDVTMDALCAFDSMVIEYPPSEADKIAKERDLITSYIENCVEACERFSLYNSKPETQVRINIDDDRLPIPIIGYIDFKYTDFCIDCKTSGRRPPKAPRTDYLLQTSVYAVAMQQEIAKILYVTPHGTQMFEYGKGDIHKNYEELISRAQNLIHRLTTAAQLAEINGTDAEQEFCNIVYPSANSWMWGQTEIAEAGKRNLWNLSVV